MQWSQLSSNTVQRGFRALPAPMHTELRLPVWLSGTPAIDALRQGLVDLHSACQHISTTFQVCA